MSETSENVCYHLICVDDDEGFLHSMQMMMSYTQSEGKYNYDLELHFLIHPDECFELINELLEAEEKIALIITDQKMPGTTGIEFLKKMDELIPSSMKILLTGCASLDSAKYAINHRLLDQYITKPIEDYDGFMAVINHALKTFHFREEKENTDRKLKEQMKVLQKTNKSLSKANIKIWNLQQAAEKIAYLAHDFRKLDINEVLDVVISRVPDIFNAQCASLFLLDHKTTLLKLVRTNHLKEKIQKPIKSENMTPMNVALNENRIIIVPDVKKSPYKFLQKEALGDSCVIIPFVVDKQYNNFSMETKGIEEDLREIRGILNLSKIIQMEDLDIIHYKGSLIRDILGINIWNAQLYQQTQRLAVIDKLTGLYNKHIFIEFLRKECERSKRLGEKFFLGIGDLDNFKTINDTHGHLVGDDLLKELGAIFHENIREYDMIARFGGDEFVFLVRDKEKSEVASIVERLHTAIAERKFSRDIKVTMSFGLASYRDGSEETSLALMERADKALYKAKAQGKDSIEFI